MAKEKEFLIRVHDTVVTVSREVYQAYYSEERRMKTLDEKDIRNGKVSIDAMDTVEMLGVEMIPDTESPSVEDAVIAAIFKEKLCKAIDEMPQEDRRLIISLYYEEISENKLSVLLGVPKTTINYRKQKALDFLKEKILKNQ